MVGSWRWRSLSPGRSAALFLPFSDLALYICGWAWLVHGGGEVWVWLDRRCCGLGSLLGGWTYLSGGCWRDSWNFIKTVLLHLGFNETFSSWIFSCISLVSFEILVNGGKTESFKPSRGLRQGDPLSSYLFIPGQEILSRLLDQELRQKSISGIKTSKRGPVITHVMYADDIILFSKATRNDATTISRILDKYCLWSGQLVNRNKSDIFFLQAHSKAYTKGYQKHPPYQVLEKRYHILRSASSLDQSPI